MRSIFGALLITSVSLAHPAHAETTAPQDQLSAEVSGYRVMLRGEVGGWLSSCRYPIAPTFGPYVESVDWGDGKTSAPGDFDRVSCGNIARHLYEKPGEYDIVVTRTGIGGANDELVYTEEFRATAVVKPAIAVDVAEDGTARIGGQLGESLASCNYPRGGRGYFSVSVNWGDGHMGTSCPETQSHRYKKPGRYTITIGMTAPGPDDGPVHATTSVDVVIPKQN